MIDVGVAHGTYDLYDAFPDARLLLVEPMAEFGNALKAISAERAAEVVLAAAGAAPGAVEMFFGNRLDGASSVIGFPNRRSVPVVRVDDEVTARDLPGPYLLKIDVQGAEREVLDGAPNTLAQSVAVLMEVGLYDFGRNGFDLAAAVDYMERRGFKAFDLYDPMTLGNGAIAQVDIAFVPHTSTARLSPQWLTPAQDRRREIAGRLRHVLGI